MSAENIVEFKDAAYDGASQTNRKFRNWLPVAWAADLEFATSQHILVARCRDSYINNPVARAIIDRIVDCTCGNGLKLQVKVALPDNNMAMEWEQKIESMFDEWAKSCDFIDLNDFGGLQVLCLRTMLLSGDVLVNTILEDTLKLHIFEADQLCNPAHMPDNKTMRGGVETNEFGKPIAYHVMWVHPGDLYPEFKWERIPILGEYSGLKRIFHLFETKRPGQHRGIPILAPILSLLKVLEKYTESELTAAYMASCVAIFVKKHTTIGIGITGNTTTQDRSQRNTIQLAPGMIVELEPDEEIVPFDPQRPNTSYDLFLKSILTQVCAGVGLPIEFALMSFNSSYSASRAAILQAWKLIEKYRELFVRKLCDPVFDLWLRTQDIPEEIKSLVRTKWIGPSRGAIDEQKEILAAKERILLGISSRKEECEELRGSDWQDVQNQLINEEAMRVKGGLAPVNTNEPVLSNNATLQDTGDATDENASKFEA
jgi:lambda family phage portal protein